MNKIGVILGIVVLLIALILYIITVNIDKGKKEKPTESSVVSTASTTSMVVTTEIEDTKDEEVTKTTTVTEDTTTTEASKEVTTTAVTSTTPTTPKTQEEDNEPEMIEKPTEVMIEIDETSLPEGLLKTEVAVVAKKAICLVDGELYYTVTLLLPDNTKINYFASKGGYDLLNSGVQVKVEYTVYKSNSGKLYNIINNVSLIN